MYYRHFVAFCQHFNKAYDDNDDDVRAGQLEAGSGTEHAAVR